MPITCSKNLYVVLELQYRSSGDFNAIFLSKTSTFFHIKIHLAVSTILHPCF